MLQHSFYTVVGEPAATATSVAADIRLHADHAIFAGHFPGQPVVPGVCMLQIIKELLAGATQCSLRLMKASNIKFLTVLTPETHEIVSVQLKFESFEDGILVSEATISAGPDRFIRLQQAHYATRITEHPSPFAESLRPA
jgi:3-hydroxyacyl-[acyl-carrier-protein] dehydratase